MRVTNRPLIYILRRLPHIGRQWSRCYRWLFWALTQLWQLPDRILLCLHCDHEESFRLFNSILKRNLLACWRDHFSISPWRKTRWDGVAVWLISHLDHQSLIANVVRCNRYNRWIVHTWNTFSVFSGPIQLQGFPALRLNIFLLLEKRSGAEPYRFSFPSWCVRNNAQPIP